MEVMLRMYTSLQWLTLPNPLMVEMMNDTPRPTKHKKGEHDLEIHSVAWPRAISGSLGCVATSALMLNQVLFIPW